MISKSAWNQNHRCRSPAKLEGYCMVHHPVKRLAALLKKQAALTIQIAEATLHINGIQQARLRAT